MLSPVLSVCIPDTLMSLHQIDPLTNSVSVQSESIFTQGNESGGG